MFVSGPVCLSLELTSRSVDQHLKHLLKSPNLLTDILPTLDVFQVMSVNVHILSKKYSCSYWKEIEIYRVKSINKEIERSWFLRLITLSLVFTLLEVFVFEENNRTVGVERDLQRSSPVLLQSRLPYSRQNVGEVRNHGMCFTWCKVYWSTAPQSTMEMKTC